MVSVPVRDVVAVRLGMLKVTVPLPVPLPPVTLIQPALLVAVQAHPLPAVTATLPVPPDEVNENVVGDIT
jgi:hypothetical protein